MPLAAGTRLGPYVVEASIGAGGMGEVYRARDTRLAREVALKLLPAGASADAARLARFTREAQAVAALNHPHIVTLHSIEECDGCRFLTMELVRGRRLDALIPSGGLEWRRLFDLAAGIAEALVAAHEHGIVHRDLKPANIMVGDDGRVKVLDFGLAAFAAPDAEAAARDATRLGLTSEGTILGTMPYMSPEQLEGLRVDHRSDLFSLGIICYEMATSRRPFTGESAAALISAILRDTPPPLDQVRPDTPPGLSRLVAACLQKRAEERVRSAGDVRDRLHELREACVSSRGARRAAVSADIGGGSDLPRIAVLPFAARGSDPDAVALAEGLTEDITGSLTRFPYLRVVAHGDAVRVAGVAQVGEPAAAAARVGVRWVIEGTVRLAGASLRIAARLVDTQTGAHLWAETYDRALTRDSLFAVQDDVMARIVATVADSTGVLVRAMATPLLGRPLQDLSLEELQLRFLAYLPQFDPDEHARLLRAFEHAVEARPDLASGWAVLSALHDHEHVFFPEPRPDALTRARHAAERAVSLDVLCQFGWHQMATISFLERDANGLRASADRALALNPLHTFTTGTMGMWLAFAGDWERGLPIVRQAMSLNPGHPGWLHLVTCLDHFRRGEYEEALLQAKRVGMPGNHNQAYCVVATAGHFGRVLEARAALDDARRLRPEFLDLRRMRQSMWMLWSDDLVDRLAEGLRRAQDLVASSAESPTPSSGASVASSLAVLPFADLSATHDQGWFAEGIAEDIRNALAQVPGIRTVARRSSFALRDGQGDVREMAELLGVAHVLEGSVRRATGRVRVTAQLVRAADATQIWSERFDRAVDDVFAIQDEIASSIVTALRGRLAPHAQARRHTPSVDAYEAFLRARHELFKLTPQGWSRGQAFLDRATELDPRFAAPHAARALGQFLGGMHGMQPMRDAAPHVRTAAQRALDLDPGDLLPHFLLGGVALVHDYDWASGDAHFRRAWTMPHVTAEARWAYASLYLGALGRFDESVAEMRRAVEQDPLNASLRAILSAHLQNLGDLDAAIGEGHRAVAIEDMFVSRYLLGEAYLLAGHLGDAIAQFEIAKSQAPWSWQGMICGLLGAACARAGDRARAAALLAEMGHQPRPVWGRVVYHLHLHELDDAATWFARMIEERDPFALVYVNAPLTRRLHAHPAWPSLRAAMRLPL
jgi:TolB-like protein